MLIILVRMDDTPWKLRLWMTYMFNICSFIPDKADKKAEREKREKVEQERIDREDEMREISIKLRKRLVIMLTQY